jgi:hypothetical protein
MRRLIRTRWSGGFLAAGVASLLAFQALIASDGLGMSAASPFGPPVLDICSGAAKTGKEELAGNDRTDPFRHPPQCPFCFVAAECAGHPVMAGDVKDLPAFAGRDVAAPPYVSTSQRVVHSRLLHATDNPCGPPSFPV